MAIISEKWRNRWSSNEIIVLVLASLGMQIGLIFLAPLRKRITRTWVALTLWLLYLTADSVATLALGNISRKTGPGESNDSETRQGDLTVLWAPFLLLHLGGPDSITSYSVEDNELWWRHLLQLVVQVVITVYIFWQSPPHEWLWIPTIFVFIPGLIKFAERTHALRLGSKDNLKDKIISQLNPANDTKKVEFLSKSMKKGKSNSDKKTEDNLKGENISEQGAGPDNKTKDEILTESTRNSKKESEREIEDNSMDKSNSEKGAVPENETKESERESQAICEAYVWFDIFKRLLVDVTFSSNLLMQSQDYFSDMTAREALNMVAIELSFLYDILHTKAVHMHYNFNRVLRCSTMVSIIAALIVFHHLDKQKYASKDITITYILFSAGLILEVVAALLLVSSDWTVVSLRKKDWGKGIACAITKIVKQITFMKGKSRWSKTIGQFNLVSLCLRDRDTFLVKIMRIIKIKRIWDNMRESKSIPLSVSLVETMFAEAKRRAQNVHIYNVLLEARSYRGNKTLERHDLLKTLEWTMKREFDESVILWHVATDICYHEDQLTQQQSMMQSNDSNQREVSWNTSNYMIYLLTQQQSMMQLGYGKTRFEATCSVVKKKLKKFKGKRERDYKEIHAALEKNDEAPPVHEQNNTPVSDDGRQHGWRCWGKRMGKEDKRKNEEAPPVVEQNEEVAPVPEQTNALVPDDGRQHGWRCWGKRMGKEDKRKNEEAPPVVEQNEEVAPVPEQTNALVPDDGRQHGWRCWGKRKSKEDKRKNEEAPPVVEQNEEVARVPEQTNALVPDDGRQHGWRCWGKRKSKEDKRKNEEAPPVVEQNEEVARVPEQTNALVPDDGCQHGWRCWGKRKSKDEKAKLKDQEDMGKAVIMDSLKLARELQKLKPEIKWKLISETWMEMLGYAAIHCDSYQHAKSLSRGGELLTHLWLLMAQLGVVEEHKMQQFQSGSV